MQANEVLKIILGFDNVLSGNLLCYNAKTSEMVSLKISKSASEIEKIQAKKASFQNQDFEAFCQSPVIDISAEEAFLLDDVQFIDVRELGEKPMVELSNCIQIPLGKLEQELNKIDSEKNKILFCQVGIRSKAAVKLLQKHGFNNCYNLKTGALAILEQLKLKMK